MFKIISAAEARSNMKEAIVAREQIAKENYKCAFRNIFHDNCELINTMITSASLNGCSWTEYTFMDEYYDTSFTPEITIRGEDLANEIKGHLIMNGYTITMRNAVTEAERECDIVCVMEINWRE